jgi:hypothetical protein
MSLYINSVRTFLVVLPCLPLPAQSVALPNPAGPASGQASLSTAPDGSILMSWLEPAASGAHDLRYAVWNGNTWSNPVLIASGSNWFVNSADLPGIHALPGGTVIAHWLEQNQYKNYLYGIKLAKSLDNGKTWKLSYVPLVEQPEAYTGFASFLTSPWGLRMAYLAPQTAKPGPGRELVGSSALRVASFRSNGTIESDIELDRDVCTCCPTALALTVEGPIVAYRDHLPGEVRDISVIKWSGAGWSAPVPVAQDRWTINACPVNGPALAASNAAVVLAWFTGAQNQPKVQAAWSQDSAATFGRALRLDGGNPVGRPGALLLDDGSAVVSWVERTGIGVEVRLRRISPDGRIGAPVIASSVAGARSVGTPQIAAIGRRILVAWTTDRVRTAMTTLPPLPGGL